MWTNIPGKRKGKKIFQMAVAVTVPEDSDILFQLCHKPSAIAYKQLNDHKYEVLYQSSDWRFLLQISEHISTTWPNVVKDVRLEYVGPSAGVV